MEAIHRITCNDGNFASALRQNVIRVIGSYGREQEPDEYDEKIKAKQEEMVSLIAENAAISSYTDEFDERYRRIAEEISTLKEEQLEKQKKKIDKYGSLLALLVWIPVVGDVSSVALGFYRTKPKLTLFLMYLSRMSRFLLWVILYLIYANRFVHFIDHL